MSTDRTPEQMREDSAAWGRADYPMVAIGRYRAAADQVERLERQVAWLRQGLESIASPINSEAGNLHGSVLQGMARTSLEGPPFGWQPSARRCSVLGCTERRVQGSYCCATHRESEKVKGDGG